MFLKDSLNTRTLKGIANKSLLRSDYPLSISEDEKKLFVELGVKTIIDLRSASEIARKPNPFDHDERFYVHYCPMPGGEKVPSREEDIPIGYFNLARNKESILKILTVIADAQHGVFFHCASGKDRTGVVAALLQMIAGVSKETIVQDYEESYQNIKQIIEDYKKKNPNAPSYLGFSKEEYMKDFLFLFEKEFKTIENYLSFIGLSKKDIDNLKKSLL